MKASAAEIRKFARDHGATVGGGPPSVERCKLILPYPPSVNNYWRSMIVPGKPGRKAHVGVFVSALGKQYQQDVLGAVAEQGRVVVPGNVALFATFFPPDHIRRDLDNGGKALLDALVAAGVIEDDSLIQRLVFKRRSVRPNGEVEVTIRTYGEQQGRLFE